MQFLQMVGMDRLHRRHLLAMGAALACAPSAAAQAPTGNDALTLADVAPGFAAAPDTPESAAIEARIEALLRAFPYPLTLVPISDALQAQARMRDDGGDVPVLLGSFIEVGAMSETMQRAAPTSDPHRTISFVPAVKHPDYLRDYRAARNAAYADQMERGWNGAIPPDMVEGVTRELARLRAGPDEQPMGEWPATPNPMRAPDLSGMDDNTIKFLIARIPTRDWTEVPAFMMPGDPSAVFHIAAYRSWRDRFGAELVAWTGETVSFRIARPPATREEALRLADELCLIRGDVMFNRYYGLADFAAGLMASTWWDISGE
jgi:hypothetical protein